MIAPSYPRLATHDPAVVFVVDPTAEPGNPLPALVRLLIGIRNKRRDRTAADLAGEQAAQSQSQDHNPQPHQCERPQVSTPATAAKLKHYYEQF